MSARIKVIVVGLGQIGIETCKLLLNKKSFQLLAAVDIDPTKAGKDLGEFLNKKDLGIKVYPDLKSTLKEFEPEVTILTSKSHLNEIANDIFLCIEHHSSIISSCEELLFPFENNKKLAEEIDAKAKEYFVHVLGTGVNPGFVMDSLPVFLTSVCDKLDSIKIKRVVDLTKRRKALQQKIGLGLSKTDFQNLVKQKKIGHVGLLESAQFVDHYLNLNSQKFDEKIVPILAEKNYKTKYITIPKGTVVGMQHTVIGKSGSKKLVELILEMTANTNESYDEIVINGNPKFKVKIENGIFGDTATVSMMVNVIPNLLHARYGLITMKDINIPSFLNI